MIRRDTMTRKEKIEYDGSLSIKEAAGKTEEEVLEFLGTSPSFRMTDL